MAVIAFRKDNIQQVTLNGYLDENGDWHQGDKTLGTAIPCDAVPAGAAATITLEDGTEQHYSYTLYLSTTCPDLELGSRIQLTKANGETREAEVLGFHRYQLHSMAWI